MNKCQGNSSVHIAKKVQHRIQLNAYGTSTAVICIWCFWKSILFIEWNISDGLTDPLAPKQLTWWRNDTRSCHSSIWFYFMLQKKLFSPFRMRKICLIRIEYFDQQNKVDRKRSIPKKWRIVNKQSDQNSKVFFFGLKNKALCTNLFLLLAAATRVQYQKSNDKILS